MHRQASSKIISHSETLLSFLNMQKSIQAWMAIALIFLCSGTESLLEADRIVRLPGQPPVSFQQFSGYITVDEKQHRSLFYYFVEAETSPASKPLVLWLNGGPGCSSVGAGAFVEHGPFRPTTGNNLVRNEYSWNKEANMLYLESPAGVGFSYSANQTFYSYVNDEMTARDNLVFLRRWFVKFPQYKQRDFFIAGESYAGHYVPQLAQLIIRSKVNFNLKGIAIGNPLLEFNTDLNAQDHFYWSHGLISDSTYQLLTSVCNNSRLMREAITGTVSTACFGVYTLVRKELSELIDPYDVTGDICLSSNQSQLKIFNQQLLRSRLPYLSPQALGLDSVKRQQQVMGKVDVCLQEETAKYLNRKDVQMALHARLVGVTNWHFCSVVLEYDISNEERPTIHVVRSLVKSGLAVLVYSHYSALSPKPILCLRNTSWSCPQNPYLQMQQKEPWIVIAAICATLIFLTTGSISEAGKTVALPGQPTVSFQQYAGYITIDEQQKRALFYYFAEAEIDPATKPLVLWLNGGPGCSSIGAGAFCEHGPFKPSGEILLKNDYSWNKEANMLYLESPAGVGFSYSANDSFYTYVTDEITAQDNLVFLERWFDEFPEYKGRDFFITGESYAGHYVPQLATLIVQSKAKFNLKGIAIGNPLLEFNTDFNSRAEFFWSHGLISDDTYEIFTTVCNYSQIRRQYQSGSLSLPCSAVNSQVRREVSKYVDAYDVTLDVCLSSIESQSQVLKQMEYTGTIDVCVEDETIKYLNRKDVLEALHAQLVGVDQWTVCSDVVKYEMENLEISTVPLLAKLLKSGIRVHVYSGDQDSVIPLTGTRTVVNGLAKELGLNTTVPYRTWFQGKQVAGWTQVYGNILSFATIRGASHEAPFSQPERSFVLFNAFLEGKQLPPPTVY
ncbi:hypothetical protein POTOM_024697 [Populus tomentosa]|uniref:Carboxypeptidase n=1 Tax=Populus tomentosa TaxID=118781 RepID=A0A8X7ZGT1_POPTO|nr:hypothetical protein POTOM_024697 [Populus tomentosa]